MENGDFVGLKQVGGVLRGSGVDRASRVAYLIVGDDVYCPSN